MSSKPASPRSPRRSLYDSLRRNKSGGKKKNEDGTKNESGNEGRGGENEERSKKAKAKDEGGGRLARNISFKRTASIRALLGIGGKSSGEGSAVSSPDKIHKVRGDDGDDKEEKTEVEVDDQKSPRVAGSVSPRPSASSSMKWVPADAHATSASVPPVSTDSTSKEVTLSNSAPQTSVATPSSSGRRSGFRSSLRLGKKSREETEEEPEAEDSGTATPRHRKRKWLGSRSKIDRKSQSLSAKAMDARPLHVVPPPTHRPPSNDAPGHRPQ